MIDSTNHERQVLAETLARCEGNVAQAASDLGLSLDEIHRLIAKHQLQLEA